MSTNRKPPRWLQIFKVPGCHKFFHDRNKSGAVAIADDSGRVPSTTDDGILYLDFNRPLVFAQSIECKLPDLITPLLTEDGEESSTFSSIKEAVQLIKRFGFKIDDKGLMKEAREQVMAMAAK